MTDLDRLNPGILRPQGVKRRPRSAVWGAFPWLGWAALALLALAAAQGLS